MGQALYRKYRPLTLDQTLGQGHITQALQSALDTGRINHAYLFTGPRGVGKTSVARILAHSINNQVYNGSSSNIDIIEIDAASNRRIEEIRDLREKSAIAPVLAKYKVYIVDEVHMLTKEAFNALLKTLEEPPSHVVFILATTDSHKLPATIVSRCLRFHFKPIDNLSLAEHLSKITIQEGFKATPEALTILAERADGSFRDGIGLLEQAFSYAPVVTVDTVQTLIGLAPEILVKSLLENISNGSVSDILANLEQALNYGASPNELARQISSNLRSGIVEKGVFDKLSLLSDLMLVPSMPDGQMALEIALIKSALTVTPKHAGATAPPATQSEAPKNPEITPKPKNQKPKNANKTQAPDHDSPEAASPLAPSHTPASIKQKPKQGTSSSNIRTQTISLEEAWPIILAAIKKKHNTLYSVVRMASPQLDGETLSLLFGYAFHQKKLSDNSNKSILAGIASDILGHPVKIDPIVDADLKNKTVKISDNNTNANQITKKTNAATIDDVFGESELL